MTYFSPSSPMDLPEMSQWISYYHLQDWEVTRRRLWWSRLFPTCEVMVVPTHLRVLGVNRKRPHPHSVGKRTPPTDIISKDDTNDPTKKGPENRSLSSNNKNKKDTYNGKDPTVEYAKLRLYILCFTVNPLCEGTLKNQGSMGRPNEKER